MQFIWVSNISNWHFMWSSNPHKDLAVCEAEAVPSFLSYLKTLSVGLVLGIEPATTCSAVILYPDLPLSLRMTLALYQDLMQS